MMLGRIKSEKFRDANDHLQILFHRSDPRVMKGKHGASHLVSERKPDIVITSLASARRASPVQSGLSWNEITQKCASSPPTRAFEWRDVLSSLELELTRGELSPPSNPLDNMPDPVSHADSSHSKKCAQELPTISAIKRIKSTQGILVYDMSSVGLTVFDADGSVPVRRSPRNLPIDASRGSEAPANNKGTQSTLVYNTLSAELTLFDVDSSVQVHSSPRIPPSEPFLGSSNPPASTERKPTPVTTPSTEGRKISHIVQTGLYATEMLRGSLGVSHAVNLLITGMLYSYCPHQRMFILLQIA